MSFELRVLLVVASVCAFAYIVSKIKKSKLRIDDSIFWIISSVFFVVIAAFPSLLIHVAKVVGFESPANLVFLLVVGLIFLKLFMLSVNLSVLTEKNSQLVQYISLLERKFNDGR